MATYKLSLFALFLIILAALVISMLVGNWFQTTEYHKEGMISFYNGKPSLMNVKITDYSGPIGNGVTLGSNVVLVYDSIFFDQDNANVIEVDSTALNGNVMIGNIRTGNAEINGSSIQNIYVFNSIDSSNLLANVNTYSLKNNTLSNTKPTKEAETTFEKSYTEMVYGTNSPNTDNYTVFILPWNDNTYVHIINNKKVTNVNTTWFGPGNKKAIIEFNESNSKLPFSKKTPPMLSINENLKINTLVIQEKYHLKIKIYQLSDCIFFDNNNGVLIVFKDINYTSFKAYNQSGTEINTTLISKQKRDYVAKYSVWTNKLDEYGNLMIIYINNGSNIMISLVRPTGKAYGNGNIVYTLFNVQRFNRAGLDTGPSSGQTGASFFVGSSMDQTVNFRGPGSGQLEFGAGSQGLWGQGMEWGPEAEAGPRHGLGPGAVGGPTGMMNDYYQWFYYWATQGLNNNPNSPNFNYSDDYIMKTQIVPPVCPSCPSCPDTGTCTHCGGNGGSGTQTSDGTSLVEDGSEDRNLNVTGEGITITDAANTVGGVLNNAISQPANIAAGIGNTIEKGASGAVEIGRDTVSGAVDIAKDTTSGAVGLAKDTTSGAVGLAKDTASGALNEINMIGSSAVGLGKDIVGGTIGLGKDIVGGIANLGKRQGQDSGQEQGQGQGVGSNQYGYANSYGGGSAANSLLPKNTASVVDQSNLYGAMPNKGNSNYMPIGSDFSKFGR